MIIRVENAAWHVAQPAGAFTWDEFSFQWPAEGLVTGLLLAEYRESNPNDRAELEMRILRRQREIVTTNVVAGWLPACVGGNRYDFAQWTRVLFEVHPLEEWRIQVRRNATDVEPDLFFDFFSTVEGEADL